VLFDAPGCFLESVNKACVVQTVEMLEASGHELSEPIRHLQQSQMMALKLADRQGSLASAKKLVIFT
jgi:hypothetical protein